MDEQLQLTSVISENSFVVNEEEILERILPKLFSADFANKSSLINALKEAGLNDDAKDQELIDSCDDYANMVELQRLEDECGGESHD